MIKIKSIQGWRRFLRIIHSLLLPGLPFLRINNESALRFDIPSLRLHFFGTTLWMDEFFIVLVATLFLTFLIVFVTVMFGRIWCGWLCPQTVLTDLTEPIERTSRKGIMNQIWGYLWATLLSIIVGASLVWYFVSPYEFLGSLLKWNLGSIIWGFWIVLTGIVFLDLIFLRRRFCATVCPYAKMQGMLFDSKTLTIAFDTKRQYECMDCRACVQVCPVQIDIRQGANIACIQCAKCVDKCGDIFRRKDKKGLINYFWGGPGTEGSIIRQNAIITGVLTVVSLLFLIYLGGIRTPFEITILPETGFQPRFSANNELINSFVVSFENRKNQDETIHIDVPEGFRVIPDVISLKSGELKRVKIILSGRGDVKDIVLTFRTESLENVIKKEVTLIRP